MKCKCRGFINNERMPVKYTGFGEDISPEITLEGLPENTVSLAKKAKGKKGEKTRKRD